MKVEIVIEKKVEAVVEELDNRYLVTIGKNNYSVSKDTVNSQKAAVEYVAQHWI